MSGRLSWLLLITMLTSILLSISCVDVIDETGKDMKSNTYSFVYKGITIFVKTESADKKNDKPVTSSLSALFDRNPDTVWSPRKPSCQTELTFAFSHPVYIQEMIVLNGYTSKNNAYENHNRAKKVSISTYKDEEDVSFEDHFTVILEDIKSEQNIPFIKSRFSGILRTKALSFNIDSCYEGPSGAAVGLREMKFKFADTPRFTPTMTVDDIRRKFGANEKSWYIKSSNIDDPIVEEVIANLMFMGLRGSVTAEKLFYSYSSPGAAAGEMHSYLLSWYELTKAVNNKK